MSEEPVAYWDPHHGKLLYAKADDYADCKGVGVIADELTEMSLIPLYLNPPKRPFVRLTKDELLELGVEIVGPMSGGELQLMVITQEALAEKNK